VDYRVRTDGTGRSWVEVPPGDDLGGHLDTVRRCAVVDSWGCGKAEHGITLIPTYAYDRVVVAGLH